MLDTPKTGIAADVLSMEEEISAESAKALIEMINEGAMVGDLYKMDYRECVATIHDTLRQRVGGIPMGCFLLASRLVPGSTPQIDDEDAGIILLRVTGQARLPNAGDTDFGRFNASQRAADTDRHWDDDTKTDQFTLNQLRFAGLACRVIGTFRIDGSGQHPKLVFGNDISNFYSGRGMKVYKPSGAALAAIVNFSRSPQGVAERAMRIGHVRYAASLSHNAGNAVEVKLDPSDLLARRTALFGMSRTGKSNTTKIVASRVFQLRGSRTADVRVGQLIFDVNGEYANENVQDSDGKNASALRNISLSKAADKGDVVTYGLTEHPNDPGRRIVKINFYGTDPSSWMDEDEVRSKLDPLVIGKQKIDQILAEESSKYIKTFRDTHVDAPDNLDRSSSVRYQRFITVYRAILHKAGFKPPANMQRARLQGLFSRELLVAMRTAGGEFSIAADILGENEAGWDQVGDAFKSLRSFIAEEAAYRAFNQDYASRKEGRSWADDRLTGLLALLEYPNGPRSFRRLQDEHDPRSTSDYARDIVDDLVAGRLVIFDQSTGDPESNRNAAERIMWSLFNRQKSTFTLGSTVPDVLVYAEEAHNLLPNGTKVDLQNIWSRVAKEGSKYRIGFVYATQEPSSIQDNILKNTDNWFIAHLNNSDETHQIRKYFDFEDFEDSILQVPEPGFIRMRTLSNPYTVPVQIEAFKLKV